MTTEKKYDPHVVVVWPNSSTVAVKEFSHKEEAEEKYEELVQKHAPKVVLAQVVKSHGEG